MNSSDGRERRASPRYAVRVPVKVRVRGTVASGYVRDLSSLGARIEEVAVTPLEGAVLELEFALLHKSAPLILKSEVVRSTNSGGFCVRFIQVSPRTESVLRLLIPKIAHGRADDDPDDPPTYSGSLEIKIGTALHESIARLAESEGLDAVQWVRDSLERTARDALESKGREGGASSRHGRKVRIG